MPSSKYETIINMKEKKLDILFSKSENKVKHLIYWINLKK